MVLPGPLIETWALYSVGSLIIFARIACRWRMIGISSFQADDYLIVLAWLTYTAMTLAAHIVGSNGDLHALSLAERQALAMGPPEAAEPLIIGTQWFCIGVATYITFIWLLKLNMLFLYQRIVNGLWVEKFIKPTMGLVGVTYVSTLMILFLPCRPYDRMWIVFPDQGEFCKPQSFLNMVPPLVMNLVTDLCIMAIPAPVILPVRTTWLRKLGLMILFFAGFFIMSAAVMRVMFVLVFGNGATAAIWSCREDIVAIVVGQAILIRPIFTKCFWSRRFTCTAAQTKSSPPPRIATEVLPLANRHNRGKKDPFSLSAALDTVRSHESDKISVVGSSSSSTRTATTFRPTPPPKDTEMDVADAGYIEYGLRHAPPPPAANTAGLVISVSHQVVVQNVESPSGYEGPLTAGDCLKATNQAQCWKGQ